MNVVQPSHEAVEIVRKARDIAAVRRPRVLLYSSADAWGAPADSFAQIARALEQSGIPVVLAALDGNVGKEFICSGLDTTVLEPGIGRNRRLRRLLRSLGTRVVLVDRSRDLPVARRAAIGLEVAVIERIAESAAAVSLAEMQRIHVGLMRRLLRPIRIA